MKKFELNEFSPSNAEEWRNKIITDLKGKPFENLEHKSVDGIQIQPDYFSGDEQNRSFHQQVSNSVKTAQSRRDWYINQQISAESNESANKKILHMLEEGVDSISIDVNEDTDIDVLFKDVLPQYIEVRFLNSTPEFIVNYLEWADGKNLPTHEFVGTFENFYHLIPELEDRIDIARIVAGHFSKMSLVNINGGYFFNQGATNSLQMGISLSMANEILAELIENGIEPANAAGLISFSLATGADYFQEIAKFRAFRQIWNVILSEYGIEGHNVSIHGMTSTWTQTIQDINNNMLRSSTQAMSAILGGCQSVTVVPFDASIRNSSEFSERMARNTQLIIRDEAFLGKVWDVAEGSYYLENMTLQWAKIAWNIFLSIENENGFIAARDKGLIDQWVKEARENAWDKVKSGETMVLGVNKYPNPTENPEELKKEKESNNIESISLTDALS